MISSLQSQCFPDKDLNPNFYESLQVTEFDH